METKDIKSMNPEELINDFSEFSQKPYRARQVYKWIVSGIESFDEMTNVPKDLRKILTENYHIVNLEIKDKKTSSDATVKYLFELPDKQLIESVLMRYKHGYSLCLSTQSGCKMGCVFCSTGQSGFSRNLSPSEMLAQIECVQKDNNIKISNIVLMGMGEPLDNYDNTIKFLKLVSAPDNLNIGMRHISLSTCGLADKIRMLAKEKMQLTLSVSLHAPNDEIRNKIMKINSKWNIKDVISACKYYISQTGRRISFEYVMIEGLNNTPACAQELAKLLRGILCHVNLIPLNASLGDNKLKAGSKNKTYAFKDILEKEGVNTTVRRTLGEDIEAACGQLKRRYLHKEVESRIEDFQ